MTTKVLPLGAFPVFGMRSYGTPWQAMTRGGT